MWMRMIERDAQKFQVGPKNLSEIYGFGRVTQKKNI